MDGLMLINKPKGITSRDVVNQISKLLRTKKIGHTGTLDPMATGVLVLCIGKATKIANLITSYNKEYIAEVTLGVETDTLDIEGSILKEEKILDITKEDINEVLKTFIGNIKQEVPIYSAVKVNGKKLYEYARENKEVKLPIKDVVINKLELIDELKNIDNRLVFTIHCDVSKGTYIRSLVRDIAKKLGTIGCMSSLIRIRQGIYKIEDCNKIEDINDNFKIISIKEALNFLPIIKLDAKTLARVKNGAIIEKIFEEDKALLVDEEGTPAAVYKIYDQDITKIKPEIML